MDVTFSSRKVCGAAGITYRQLDYWLRCGVLHAVGKNQPGSGYAREFSEREYRIAPVIGRLFDLGAGTDVARRVAMTLRLMPERDLHGTIFVGINGEVMPDPLTSAAWFIDLDCSLATPPELVVA